MHFYEHQIINGSLSTSLATNQSKLQEIPKGQAKWTIQRNWQQDEEKQSKNTTQYISV
jgi:hypothetical protein